MAEEDDFERQLLLEKEEQYKKEQGYTYTDPNDGTVYEWDQEKQAWFPKVQYVEKLHPLCAIPKLL